MWRWGQRIDRAFLLQATLLAGVVLGLALPRSAGAASSSATITNVTYDPSQPSAPASCMAPPGLSGSGSESYTTAAEQATWEWTVPATLMAGASAHIKVTSQSFNSGGSDAAIGMSTPQEFGTTPSSPSQVIATVPVGAPGSASAEQSYTFNPTREFVNGEKLLLRISFGCANWVYEYTGHAAPSSCNAFDAPLAAHAALACTVPKKLPLTPITTRPRAGVKTSYAAPQDFTHPVTIPGVAIRPNDVSATVEIGMSRDSFKLLNDDDFAAAVENGEISNQNIDTGARICAVEYTDVRLRLDVSARLQKFVRCVSAVAQILQRAEKLHQKPKPAIDAAAACRVAFARLKGARHAARVRVTCARTSAGIRITIRPTDRGRKLRSVIGASPSLIIGRLRSAAEPVQPRDRVNVRWTTSTR
jgi:hypothetical protein